MVSRWAWEEGSGWTHTLPLPQDCTAGLTGICPVHTSRLQPGGRLHPGCPTCQGKQRTQPSEAPGGWPEALLPGLPGQDAAATGSQLFVQGLEQQICTRMLSH